MGLKTLPLTIFLQPVPLPPRLISMCAQKSSNDTSEVSSLAMQPTTGLSGHQLHPSDSSEASTDSTHATSTVGTKDGPLHTHVQGPVISQANVTTALDSRVTNQSQIYPQPSTDASVQYPIPVTRFHYTIYRGCPFVCCLRPNFRNC
ncbi:hypothetical protein M408DRAFT_114679 [Serendipita vermifera MAFF 305830]|uniref:Uncharacterized protein n=1 Tax=Serendipita vermifera MAFF 305830 TaxID=933852 RepID=A0A0C3BDI3_SERVB|nr:hypothetical protein M408DRAFT_114679 [Serendipita vermifera MAFF 305830]